MKIIPTVALVNDPILKAPAVLDEYIPPLIVPLLTLRTCTLSDPDNVSPLPLINNDPVITALPENGNVAPVEFNAKLAVVANELDTAVVALPLKLPVNPPVDIVDPVTVNPLGKVIYPDAADAKLAVVANEEEIAFCAQLLVPTNAPVNDPVNEPVLICTELDTVPDGSIVGAYDALIATDAVLAYEAEVAVPADTA